MVVNGGKLSPYELAFGVKLGANPNSKMISKLIMDSLGSSQMSNPTNFTDQIQS
jgi:hypothetical protein